MTFLRDSDIFYLKTLNDLISSRNTKIDMRIFPYHLLHKSLWNSIEKLDNDIFFWKFHKFI